MFKPRGKKSKAWVRLTLRTLKWGTLAAALLIAGVWAGGERTACDSFQQVGGSWIWCEGHPGGIEIFRTPPMNLSIYDKLFWPNDMDFYDNGRIWVPSFQISGPSQNFQTIMIPYWLPILLFASISYGLFWRDRRASRRVNAGDCPTCGYSRAGLALDAVCPECGKPKV